MQRSIILTENAQCIFRLDANQKNGQDNLEKEIATFIVQLENKKNMIDSKKVIKQIQKMNHLGIDTIVDFFSNQENINRFTQELNKTSTEIRNDFSIRFSKQNIKAKLLEALKL